MTATEALQEKINERGKVTAFVTVPPGATFLELRDLDYEIARLRFLVEQEQQAACPSKHDAVVSPLSGEMFIEPSIHVCFRLE
jgi:hypothetical protein